MNNIFIKRNCLIVISTIFIQFAQAQIKLPYNERDCYLTKVYEMTPKQIEEYNKVIEYADSKWNGLKNVKCPLKSRQQEESKITEELCVSLKKILPSAQYNRWLSNHKGNLKARIYKEDLGMTNIQYVNLEKANKILESRINEIPTLKVSGTEQIRLRDEAFKQFSDALYSQFNSALASYLVQENRVTRMAKILTAGYSIISETKAIQYAILTLKYNEDRAKVIQVELRSKKRREQNKILREEYQQSLKKLLSADEYIACIKYQDHLYDMDFVKTYQITNLQLKQYKNLKKKHDILFINIRNSNIGNAQKRAKRQEANTKFELGVKDILSLQQYNLWKQDQEYKKKNK